MQNNQLKYKDPDGKNYWGFSDEEVAFYERVNLGQLIGPLSPDQSKKSEMYVHILWPPFARRYSAMFSMR